VFTGGFVGGLARYVVTLAWPAPPYSFPWATFLVNTSGAFALALLLVLVIDVLPPTTCLRPALGTGFLGAFTTFSSVATAVDQLVVYKQADTAAIYLVASTAAGLSAASFGLLLGRAVAAYRHRSRPPGPR
jgi:CrcB protein